MSDRPAFDADVLAVQAAAAIGLSVPEACRAGVVENLRILADHAARVLAFELPRSIESAAEFVP